MSDISREELSILADDMTDSELAEFLLLNHEMSAGGEAFTVVPDDEMARKAHAATVAAARLFNIDVPAGEIVVLVDFASRARTPEN